MNARSPEPVREQARLNLKLDHAYPCIGNIGVSSGKSLQNSYFSSIGRYINLNGGQPSLVGELPSGNLWEYSGDMSRITLSTGYNNDIGLDLGYDEVKVIDPKDPRARIIKTKLRKSEEKAQRSLELITA